MSIRARLEALESKLGPTGIAEVTIHGGLPDLGPDDHASLMPSGDGFVREPDEAVDTFKARVRSRAAEAKATLLVWGGLPKDDAENDPWPQARGGAA